MIFRGKFDKDKNVEKIEFKFKMDEDVKRFSLNLNKGPFEHIIISLEDSEGRTRVLTSFKTSKKKYNVTNHWETTSNCCIPGAIPSGEWKLKILKTYSLEDEFELEIKRENGNILKKENMKKISLRENYIDTKEWYAGELHNHTNISDGNINLKDLKQELIKKNIDFIFPTEHNSVLTKYPDLDIPVIPSTELTLDNLGHFNLFGLRKLIDYYDFIDEKDKREESLKKIFTEVKSQGGYVSLNHPFHNTERMFLGLFYNIDLRDLDFIEVINSPTRENSNPYFDKKALEALDMLWSDGHKIFAVGGSDNHGTVLGDPLNYIRLDKYESKDILTNLKKGRSYISRVGEIKIKMENNNQVIYPGDEVEGDVKIKLFSSQKLIWKVIKNAQVVGMLVGNKLEISENLNEGEYLRIEGISENDEPMVIINPIYNKLKEPSMEKWFNVKDVIWKE
ncbi:CehA/McbA family metallohydrolase [Candidatus Cetobacterium colombiensis]|uniref:CehA/McbA family metallohydrolase n=1 Tax=Candidatus Cetobacterium colombiensis TaxID=3073100 RepID=A0ABU4W7R7_9FUSO|nr:CehA/McbA family metallohydrolase [Candidatus Cetobacterium colombiensis]MDX8335580.1 CehA/McbA family metallohydrolase [Candidatus Cetobacterium colombiensis]